VDMGRYLISAMAIGKSLSFILPNPQKRSNSFALLCLARNVSVDLPPVTL
jgi:hypothetical protein